MISPWASPAFAAGLFSNTSPTTQTAPCSCGGKIKNFLHLGQKRRRRRGGGGGRRTHKWKKDINESSYHDSYSYVCSFIIRISSVLLMYSFWRFLFTSPYLLSLQIIFSSCLRCFATLLSPFDPRPRQKYVDQYASNRRWRPQGKPVPKPNHMQKQCPPRKKKDLLIYIFWVLPLSTCHCLADVCIRCWWCWRGLGDLGRNNASICRRMGGERSTHP